MAANKPSTPKGMRDFSPEEMIRRNYIFDTIRNVYRKYGFLPIETPAMENLGTLLGKYGEEGDKLLFKILRSGNYLDKTDTSALDRMELHRLTSQISRMGLRYDLTVPFARYVVQHRSEIAFPFRRYQIQPVWRADNPQKGRYREFYQCDADMIGSDSLVNEYELIRIIDEVFSKLDMKVVIKINNRKVLAGISEIIGEKERITDITVAIDKLDKIGREQVEAELRERGVSNTSLDRLGPVFDMQGSTPEKLNFLEEYLAGSETGIQGVKEIRTLLDYLATGRQGAEVELDITLARGLNYYTGAIIEVKSMDMEIGSICGGGRYDDLTGIFGLPGVSGVGISFGADRIYDVLTQTGKFPDQQQEDTRLLFVNFGEREVRYILPLLARLRDKGIRAELYPDTAKMKKQMTYANKRNIPYVALIGENEMKDRVITLKDMATGEQRQVELETLVVNLSQE